MVALTGFMLIFMNLFQLINTFDASLAHTKRVELWLDANIGTSAKSGGGLKWDTPSINETYVSARSLLMYQKWMVRNID